jgi:hypothetical protein
MLHVGVQQLHPAASTVVRYWRLCCKQIKLDGSSAVITAVAEQDLVGGKELAAMITACAVETETKRRRVVAF